MQERRIFVSTMKSTAAKCPSMSASAIVTLLIVSCCSGVQCQTHLGQAEFYRPLLNDLLSALLKTVDFFASSVQFVNIDAVFGMRQCQGSLIGTLSDCESDRLSCPQELKQYLAVIIDRLNDIAQQANSYVEQQNQLRFAALSGVVLDPFIINYVQENISRIDDVISTFNTFDGEQSDECLINLMGFDQDGGAVPRCTTSKECWKFITRGGSGKYYLTHQLLYLQVGEKIGCVSELEQFLQSRGTTIRDFERHLCENIYYDTLSTSRPGTVDTYEQDLFLEQIGFCGMLGFQNFFNESWVPMILNWQSPLGCFTNNDPEWPSNPRDDEGEVKISARHYHATHRWKRSEKLMPDGCLSHKTGVAILAMGAYVRYLVSKVYAKV